MRGMRNIGRERVSEYWEEWQKKGLWYASSNLCEAQQLISEIYGLNGKYCLICSLIHM